MDDKLKELTGRLHMAEQCIGVLNDSIEEARDAIESWRSEQSDVLEEIRRYSDGDSAKEIGHYLYWHTDVTVSVIEKLFNSKSVRQNVGPLEYGYCNECKDTVYFKSRTARSNKEYTKCSCTLEKEADRRKKWDEEYAINSQKANEMIAELRSMPYGQYLQTDHWQDTREKALKRAKFKCQLCNSTDTLDVHHRTYEHRGYEYAADLIVLCRGCHAKFHGKDE